MKLIAGFNQGIEGLFADITRYSNGFGFADSFEFVRDVQSDEYTVVARSGLARAYATAGAAAFRKGHPSNAVRMLVEDADSALAEGVLDRAFAEAVSGDLL